MKSKSSKLLIDIRARLKVQPDSLEAMLHRYLNDESATYYVRHKLIMESLITYCLPLAYEHEGASKEQIRQSLIDADRLWQIHFRYMQQRLGIDLNSALPNTTPNHKAEEIASLPKSEPEVIPTTKEVSLVEEEEEEEIYPEVF
ncbi:MAG: hypothetical protein AB4368_10470 [Xenococcaceae cyanobacterium]